jgi:membrane protease YdiL (CAAX protease family)
MSNHIRFLDALLVASLCAPLQMLRTARYIVPALAPHEARLFRYGMPTVIALFAIAGWTLATVRASLSVTPGLIALGLVAGPVVLASEVGLVMANERRLVRHIEFLLPWADKAVWLLVSTFATAIGEEVVFRGVIQPVLRSSLGLPAWFAVGLTAVFYAAGHTFYGRTVVAQKFVSGGAYGVLAIATGSLIPAVIAHVVLNAIVVVEGTRSRRRLAVRGALA